MFKCIFAHFNDNLIEIKFSHVYLTTSYQWFDNDVNRRQGITNDEVPLVKAGITKI